MAKEMDQEKDASTQAKSKSRARNKRLSNVMLEDLSLEDQNNPPGNPSKRPCRDEDIPEVNDSEGPDEKTDLVTPASGSSQSPTVPAGASADQYPLERQSTQQTYQIQNGTGTPVVEEFSQEPYPQEKQSALPPYQIKNSTSVEEGPHPLERQSSLETDQVENVTSPSVVDELPLERKSAQPTHQIQNSALVKGLPCPPERQSALEAYQHPRLNVNLSDSAQDVVVQFIQQSENRSRDDISIRDINSSQAFLSEHNLAPRILLVNQQANALAEGLNRLGPSAVFHHILRTPPSVKTSKVFLKRKSAEVYRGFDPFDRVSDEIILRVFHHLPRHTMCTCALVCRRWARIVCDLSLWRRMDFGGRPLKVGILKILLERGVEVLRLNRSEVMGDFTSTVHGAPDPRRSPLSEDRMYRLQMLDMSMCNVKTSMVESMLKFCPYLRKVSLENIPVTEQLLMNLGFTSPYLDTVNLAMCQGVTSKGLQCIIDHCPSLSHLNIAWTCMSGRDIRHVIKNLPEQLLSLDISGNRDKITDKDIEILCHQCPQLRDLEVSDSTEITNAAVDTISENLTRLRRISLSRCYSITPQALVNLTSIRNLTTINVFGMMRDSSLTALEGYLKRYRVNREPFSTVARPTPTNEKVVKIWNVIPKDGPVV